MSNPKPEQYSARESIFTLPPERHPLHHTAHHKHLGDEVVQPPPRPFNQCSAQCFPNISVDEWATTQQMRPSVSVKRCTLGQKKKKGPHVYTHGWLARKEILGSFYYYYFLDLYPIHPRKALDGQPSENFDMGCKRSLEESNFVLWVTRKESENKITCIVMFLYSSMVWCHLEQCVHFWLPYPEKKISLKVPKRAVKLSKGCQKHLSYKKSLKS